MQRQAFQEFDADSPPSRGYRTTDRLGPASRFGLAALVMAGITVAWLVPPYLCWRGVLVTGPFGSPRGGPISEALTDTVLWPFGMTLAFGVIGIAQPRRRHRWFGAAAIAIACVGLPALLPGLWR